MVPVSWRSALSMRSMREASPIAGLRHLRRCRGFRRRAGLTLLGRWFAALEQIVEEAAARAVLRHGRAGEQQQWQRRERSDTGTIS